MATQKNFNEPALGRILEADFNEPRDRLSRSKHFVNQPLSHDPNVPPKEVAGVEIRVVFFLLKSCSYAMLYELPFLEKERPLSPGFH